MHIFFAESFILAVSHVFKHSTEFFHGWLDGQVATHSLGLNESTLNLVPVQVSTQSDPSLYFEQEALHSQGAFLLAVLSAVPVGHVS